MTEKRLPSRLVSDIFEQVVATGKVRGIAKEELRGALTVIIALLREQQDEFETEPTFMDQRMRRLIANLVAHYVPVHMKLQAIDDSLVNEVLAQVRYALEIWRKQQPL